jgi:hypothetical protein
MKTRWSCRRFQRLIDDREERGLTGRELSFLDAHRAHCPACRKSESICSVSLNMLRDARIEPEPDPHFIDTVVRKAKLQQTRGTWAYWSPALIGAGVACLAVLAAFQLLTPTSRKPYTGAGEANRTPVAAPYPTLDLANRPVDLR